MNLTIEQMRKIVERHRKLGTHFTKFKYYSAEKDDFFLSQLFIDSVCVDDLSAAIADHDRTDCVDFKVGDKVVLFGIGTKDLLLEIVDRMYTPSMHRVRVVATGQYGPVLKNNIRHATPEEIAVGHRIDANTDYVTDIRNHISPMTIVQGDS